MAPGLPTYPRSVTEIPPFHPVGFAAEILNERGINRRRFDSAADLLAHGAALIDQTGRNRIGGGRLLLVVQATRATHTFEAVITDCQIGRGVQAAMLNRSLLEDVLDVHWVAENQNVAPQRADEHDRLIALAEHDAEFRFERTERPLTEEERHELDGLQRLYGGGQRAFRAPWTRASYEARLSLVHERWGEHGDAARHLDYVYEVMQRQNNLLLHGSPSSYRQTMSVDAEGRPRHLNRIGPDRWWRDALSHGVLGYYLVSRVLAEEFGFDKDPIAEVFEGASCFLKQLTDQELAEVPEGSECPCGSRLAVETCHRS